ncbi:MAG: YfiR family protein [Burkholderia sp.]|nr:YfiR family protein [Burkholderia sp.]
MALLIQRQVMARRRLLRLAAALLCLSPFAPAVAESSDRPIAPAALQSQVMAASLFRFLAYVEWPPDTLPAGAPYVIAVINADAIAEELAAVVVSRTVNDRAVTVRRLKAGELPDGVHILFLGGNAGARLLQQLGKRPRVLIVTDFDGALDQGSMINFRLVDGRVRFEVAVDPLEDAGLKVSSRMLSVALQVIKATPR